MDRGFDCLLHTNSILRVDSLNQPPQRWFDGAIKLIDSVRFFRPIEFFAENIPAEAAGVAKLLPLSQESFIALQICVECGILQ
jgi:hypothetical protein